MTKTTSKEWIAANSELTQHNQIKCTSKTSCSSPTCCLIPYITPWYISTVIISPLTYAVLPELEVITNNTRCDEGGKAPTCNKCILPSATSSTQKQIYKALVINEMLCVSICSWSSLASLSGRETLPVSYAESQLLRAPKELHITCQHTQTRFSVYVQKYSKNLSCATELREEPGSRMSRGCVRTAMFLFSTAHQQTHRHLNEMGSTGRTEQKTAACRNTSFSFWLSSSIFSETWKWWQLYDPLFLLFFMNEFKMGPYSGNQWTTYNTKWIWEWLRDPIF